MVRELKNFLVVVAVGAVCLVSFFGREPQDAVLTSVANAIAMRAIGGIWRWRQEICRYPPKTGMFAEFLDWIFGVENFDDEEVEDDDGDGGDEDDDFVLPAGRKEEPPAVYYH